MDINVFITTRFKTLFDNINNDRKKTMLSNEWFSERLKLFEKYTYPSVCRQSYQNFIWIIMVDETVTRKEEIYKLRKYKRLKVVIIPDSSRKSLCESHLSVFPVKKGRVLSVRLDSDDMIHKKYIETLVEKSKKLTSPYVLTYPYGLHLYKNKFYECHKYNKKCVSPFTSLLEEDDIKSVWCCTHDTINKHMRLLNITDLLHPWVQIIHDRNYMNNPKQITFNKPIIV